MPQHYFSYLPQVSYDLDHAGQPVVVTDITRRFEVLNMLRRNQLITVPYYVDGERPDIVADKYYRQPKLDWLVLMANSMLDPFFDWPMDHWQFIDHIKGKYGSLSVAHQTVHHYEWIVQPETMTSTGIKIEERVLWVDQATYQLKIESERRTVSLFAQEQRDNDAKKQIRLIEKSYVPQVLREAERIFRAA